MIVMRQVSCCLGIFQEVAVTEMKNRGYWTLDIGHWTFGLDVVVTRRYTVR